MKTGDRVVCKEYFSGKTNSDLCGEVKNIYDEYVELYVEEYDITVRVSLRSLNYEVEELLKII